MNIQILSKLLTLIKDINKAIIKKNKILLLPVYTLIFIKLYTRYLFIELLYLQFKNYVINTLFAEIKN